MPGFHAVNRGERKINRKVLVVDNDSFFVEFLSELLEGRKYRVFRAYDGKEGISRLEREDVDLLFVDMIMPKIDGREFIRHVRSRFSSPRIPIVALSGVMIEQLDRLEEIDADYFVAKGPMEKMAGHIERLLDRIESDPPGASSERVVFRTGNLMPRRITDELIQSVNFHRAVYESAGAGVMVLDQDARVIVATRAARDLLKRPSEQVLNRQIISLFPRDEREKVTAALKKILFRQVLRKTVFSVSIGSQTIRIAVSLLKIKGDVAGWVMVMEDGDQWAGRV